MRVLFIGRTVYAVPLEASLEKKWRGLSVGNKLTVVARTTQPRFLRFRSGADFHLVPALGIEPLDILFFLFCAYFIGLKEALSKRIHVIDSEDPLIAGFVSTGLASTLKFLGTPVKLVVECHGNWREIHSLYRRRLFPAFVNGLSESLARHSFKRADVIRTVAQYLAEQIRQTAPEKRVRVFPAFIDLALFTGTKPDAAAKNILFVGTLHALKGVHFLLDALPSVLKRFPDARLVIVGEGPARHELERQAGQLSMAEHVVFAGQLPLQELALQYTRALVVVLPSLSEGFPRVPLEAMAAGKPVIASKVGGIPELVEDGITGFLVPPRDSKALADKLEWLLTHPQGAQKMGEKAREWIKSRFSKQTFYAQFNALFEEVMKAGD